MSGSALPPTYVPSFHGEFGSHPYLPKLPYRTLGGTGLQVSTLSYGGSSLAGFYEAIEEAEATSVIQECIRSGINYLDTSPWYGDSERIIGAALKGIPREAYYIGTKVGRNFTPGWESRFDFSAKAVLVNLERSLELLGLPYVDIIQIHDMEFCLDPDILLKQTLPALESVVKAGKAKYIGITGYDLELLDKLAGQSSVVDTVLSYSRFNFHDLALQKYVPAFEKKGLGVINASPVAMGLLTTRGPPAWHPASPKVKALVKQASELALSAGTTLESAALGFSLRPKDPAIATTLVSMPTKKILEENLKIVTQAVSAEEKMLYDRLTNLFEPAQPCSWEGVEVQEYRDWSKKSGKL